MNQPAPIAIGAAMRLCLRRTLVRSVILIITFDVHNCFNHSPCLKLNSHRG